MNRVLLFPSARRLRRRTRIEALVAHLIDLLDAAHADREPEPDEEDDGGEADSAPLSLNISLAPQRRIRRERAAGAEGAS